MNERRPRFIVSGIVASPRIARALEARFDFTRWRGESHEDDPELCDFLDELRWLANVGQTRQPATVATTSTRQSADSQSWMSTTRAAARLEITEDAVRAAVRRGRIPAERRNGTIQIALEDVLTYRASRRT